MHLDKIHLISNFNKDVVRNTPVLTSWDDELSDLTDDQFDRDVANKIINKDRGSQFKKLEYHAIDYVFNQSFHFQSRFSDGSYPVWYGSLDQETTFYETAFHWHRTILQDIYYRDDIPIITNRSLFTVGCSAMLIDLRKSINQLPELIEKGLESYKVTQVLSKEIHDQGQSGLYTYSARKDKGENIAIYNRKSLNSVNHLKDVKYIYDFKKSKIHVIDKLSDKLITEI